MLNIINKWLTSILTPVLKTIAVEHGMVTPESCKTCRGLQDKQLAQIDGARIEQTRILREELDAVKSVADELREENRRQNEVIKEYVDSRYTTVRWQLNMTNKIDQVLHENEQLKVRIRELEKEVLELRDQVKSLHQENLDLKKLLEERESELAACKAQLKESEE